MEIAELRSESERRVAFTLMRELRPHLDEQRYMALLAEMAPQGYRLFAMRVDGKIVGLAGAAVLTNLYYGRHLWVYDFVVAAGQRSRGHGTTLMNWLERYARAEGCSALAFTSRAERVDAHQFYETRLRYERVGYAFRKTLG